LSNNSEIKTRCSYIATRYGASTLTELLLVPPWVDLIIIIMQVLIYKVDDIGRVRSSLKPTSVSSTTTNRSAPPTPLLLRWQAGHACRARSLPLPSVHCQIRHTQKPIVAWVVEGILPLPASTIVNSSHVLSGGNLSTLPTAAKVSRRSSRIITCLIFGGIWYQHSQTHRT
jgi:hypothetical protein